MSIQAVSWALEQRIPNAGQKLVLIALCNRAEKDTGECYPSLRRLEREASMSRRTVQRHLNDLWAQGKIDIMRSFDGSGRQSANTYRIVFDPAEQKQISARHAAEGGCQIDTGEGVTHVTPEGVTGDTPNIKPSEEPSEGTAQPATLPGFASLWKQWEPRYRPDDPTSCRDMFDALPAPIERQNAIASAEFYQTIQRRRKNKPSLYRYLKERAWRGLIDAPEIDIEGRFVITPYREEWDAWIAHIAQTHGDTIAATQRASGRLIRHDRWPPSTPQQLAMAIG